MSVELADEALVQEALDGKEEAFETLFRRHYPRVYRTVYGVMGRESDAQDVVQDSWLKAWKNLPSYNFQAAFTTWLHRIAINTALDALRRRKRRRLRFRSLFSGMAHAEASAAPDPPDNRTPASRLTLHEIQIEVYSAIATLPEAQRIVFVLREIEGYSYREIAAATGCKIGTVMSRLHLAREKLQFILKPAK